MDIDMSENSLPALDQWRATISEATIIWFSSNGGKQHAKARASVITLDSRMAIAPKIILIDHLYSRHVWKSTVKT